MNREDLAETVSDMARLGMLQPPCLAVSPTMIRERARACGAGLPGSKVFYAVKANHDPDVIRTVAETGLGFEVGSIAEINEVMHLGVPPEQVISGNPIKAPEFVKYAHSRGVRMFALDSDAEVAKIASLAPGSQVVVRVAVPDAGSEWPLSGKFGVEPEHAVALLKSASSMGLRVRGVNFHVGSQCTDPSAWDTALRVVGDIFDKAGGLGLDLVNIGGGYPARYTRSVPDVREIEAAIGGAVQRYLGDVELYLEPGRYLVAEAGVFVTRVIGKAVRRDGPWVMIDVGVFNGLAEAIGGIRYEYRVLGGGRPTRCILAGPSCDGFDVIDRDVRIPEPEVGDIVLILTAGAYTTVYAGNFNGFPLPRVKVLEEGA